MPRIRIDASPSTFDFQDNGGRMDNGVANLARSIWEAPMERAQIQDQRDQQLWQRNRADQQDQAAQGERLWSHEQQDKAQGRQAMLDQNAMDRQERTDAEHQIQEMNRSDDRKADQGFRDREATAREREAAAREGEAKAHTRVWEKQAEGSAKLHQRQVDPYLVETFVDDLGNEHKRTRLKTADEVQAELHTRHQLLERGVNIDDDGADAAPASPGAPSEKDLQDFKVWSQDQDGAPTAPAAPAAAAPARQASGMPAHAQGMIPDDQPPLGSLLPIWQQPGGPSVVEQRQARNAGVRNAHLARGLANPTQPTQDEQTVAQRKDGNAAARGQQLKTGMAEPVDPNVQRGTAPRRLTPQESKVVLGMSPQAQASLVKVLESGDPMLIDEAYARIGKLLPQSVADAR